MNLMRALLLCAPFAFAACGGDDGGGGNNGEALQLLTTNLPDVHVGAPIMTGLQAKGGTAPYSFTATGLPEGIVLTTAGALSGMSMVAGRAHPSFTVTDAKGATVTKMIDLYVIPDPLTILTTSLPGGKEGTAYDQSLLARGGVAPLSWSLADGTLPQGVMVESTGSIAGTPSDFGLFTFTVRVTDDEGTKRDQALTLTLSSLNPMILTSTVPRGRVDQVYDATVGAEGGEPPYTFSLAGGMLPGGVTLANDGKLSGTPMQAGDFTFSVQVLDSSTPPRMDMAEISMNVIAALSIQTTAIAQVLRGRAYTFAMQAAGGVPPYAWSLGAGTLPMGISFDAAGAFAGMSTEIGDHPLTIRVRDAEGFQRSGLFTLKVSDRFTYDITPAAAIPAVCTATSVSYVTVPIEVVDSFAISDVNVSVDITYDWNENNQVVIRRRQRTPGTPRLILFGPDGSQTVLCGNGAAIPGGNECQPPNAANMGDMVKEWDDDGAQANRPERPLSVFDGINARGTWLLAVGIAEPRCMFTGTINSVSLSIQDDRNTDPYVVARGYRKNNLVTEPFVRACTPSCSGMVENELFLTAHLFDVGANGYAEAGEGDDNDLGVQFTWTWVGTELAGVTLDPDGHITVGDSGQTGCNQNRCAGTGSRGIVANGGGHMVNLTLRVTPPEWNTQIREY